MRTIRLGILGTADIAFRRFLPALKKCDDFEYIGIASRDINKTRPFIESYGGIGFSDYDSLIQSELIDAVYIPLPPALHYEWAKKALDNGKHVLLEKPFTTNLQDSTDLINKASEAGLALHENYMFQYHSQLTEILEVLNSGLIGDIRIIRSSFGFPLRNGNDFRYNNELGGGAVLDIGGYITKLATILLGKTIEVKTATINNLKNYDVDIFGSVTFENDKGIVFQGAFGMDCYYQCSLGVWGSKGKLYTKRIFTAPPELKPKLLIETSDDIRELNLSQDDHFEKSIHAFYNSIMDENSRKKAYNEIILQAELVSRLQFFDK
mgnify:CR=1 FL=1